MEPGRNRRRTAWTGGLLLAAALLGGAVAGSAPSAPTLFGRQAASAVTGNGGTNPCVQASNGKANCVATFGVTVGSVSGLVPTRTVSLPVTWSNPNSFDILVDGYTVTVPRTTPSACPTGSVQTPGKVALAGSKRVVVPAKKTATTSVAVTMANSAPDTCRGAQYAITVTASAVKK